VTAVALSQAAPDAPRLLTAGRGRLLLLLLGPGLMVMLGRPRARCRLRCAPADGCGGADGLARGRPDLLGAGSANGPGGELRRQVSGVDAVRAAGQYQHRLVVG